MSKHKHFNRAHQYIDISYLDKRDNAYLKAGFDVTKWSVFCRWAIEYGLHVFLHESQSTVSKYVYVSKDVGGKQFKVRFSNHRPNGAKEEAGDCDFFVGVTNKGWSTTEMAIDAVKKWCNQRPTKADF